MLLHSVHLHCLMLVGVAFAVDTIDDESRDRRDLSALLRGLASLSSIAATTRAPMRAPTTRPPTTRAPTTTTAAPPRPVPLFQKTFYKTIPGVGGLGFGFGITGNGGNQPFIFPNGPQGGFINFDSNNFPAMRPAPSAMPAAMMPAQPPQMMPAQPPQMMPAQPPQMMPAQPAQMMPAQPPQMMPAQPPQMMPAQPAPQPAQPAQPRPNQRRPAPAPAQSQNAQQPGPRVVLKFVATPFFNAQTSSPRIQQQNLPAAPINYDYYDPSFNGNFFNAQPAANTQPAQAPAQAAQPQQAAAQSPGPAGLARPVIGAFNGRAELRDNLIYQYTPTDDIYSNDGGAGNDETEGAAVDTANNAADDTNNVADDYNDDSSVAAPNSAEGEGAKEQPTAQQNDGSFEFADFNPSSDASGPLNIRLDQPNIRFIYDGEQNEVPYALKSTAPKPDPFVYTGQSPSNGFSSYNKRTIGTNSSPSFSSMRFSTPFTNFHTSTVTHHGHDGGHSFQRYQRQQKY